MSDRWVSPTQPELGPTQGRLLTLSSTLCPSTASTIAELFKTYPYLFPCVLASLPLFLGSFLGLFLDYDGGSRTGGIALPIEKDDGQPTSSPSDSQPISTVGTLTKKVSRKLSGIFASRVGSGTGAASSAARGSFGSMNSSAVPLGGVGSPSVDGGRSGKTRRTTSSAYGYDRRTRTSFASRRDSDATVRMERGDDPEGEPTVEEEIFGVGRVGGFAERLLLGQSGSFDRTPFFLILIDAGLDLVTQPRRDSVEAS